MGVVYKYFEKDHDLILKDINCAQESVSNKAKSILSILGIENFENNEEKKTNKKNNEN